MNFSFRYILIFLFFISCIKSFSQNEKAKVFYNQANLAFNSRNFTQGFALMKKALDKDPNFPDAYYKLATVFELYGEVEKSAFNYKQTIKLSPDNPAYARAYSFLSLRALQGWRI